MTESTALTTTTSLAAITRTLHEIELELIEAQGQISEALEERLSATTIAKEKKVDAYDAIMKRCTTLEQEFRDKADVLIAIARAAKALNSKLRGNIKFAMDQLGVTQLVGDTVRFSRSIGKPKVVVFDVESLPKAFLKEVIHTEPDVEKIFATLSAGQEIPGARLEEVSTLRTYAAKKETNDRSVPESTAIPNKT